MLGLRAHSTLERGHLVLYFDFLMARESGLVRLSLPNRNFGLRAFEVLINRRARSAHHLTCLCPYEALEQVAEVHIFYDARFVSFGAAAFLLNHFGIKALVLM